MGGGLAGYVVCAFVIGCGLGWIFGLATVFLWRVLR